MVPSKYQLVILFLLLSIHDYQVASQPPNCHQITADQLICDSIPPCSSHIYTSNTNVIFHLTDTTTVHSNAFINCTISQPVTFNFRNLDMLSPYAFDGLTIASNTIFTVRISPDNQTGIKSLRIEPQAFAGLVLNQKATLQIEISEYKIALVQDSLVDSIIQKEHSTVKIYFHSIEEILFTNNSSQHESQTQTSYDHNRTFSLEFSDSNRVHFTSQKFIGLQITPYSELSLAFRSVKEVTISALVFSRVQIGDYASFSLLIELADLVQLGEGLFKECEQSSGSELIINIDQIGRQASLSADYEYKADEDIEYDPDEYDTGFLMSKSRWFCVPTEMLGNLIQGESAVVKVVFSRFESSMVVSAMAFSNIQLSDNGKLHVMLSGMKGHVIVDSQAFHLLRLNDGIFELFIKHHSQNQAFTAPPPSHHQSSSVTSPIFQPSNKAIATAFNSLSNANLIINDLAFDKIYLTSRSYFRLAYIDSDSTFQLRPRALSGFHSDQIADPVSRSDGMTKISIELDQTVVGSDTQSGVEFGVVSELEDLGYFPKLVEIESYEPEMALIKNRNDTLSQGTTISVEGSLKAGADLNQRKVVDEFCRFYRPFMAPIQYQTTDARLSVNNLVYFSEPIRVSLRMDKHTEPLYCTSCLFIYLYRTVHRREDFYFVKDHLPSCFINLHYNENLYFTSFKGSGRKQAIFDIEETFKNYWLALNCPLISGLREILNTQFPGDESFKEQDILAEHCRQREVLDEEKELKGVSRDDFLRFVTGVCAVVEVKQKEIDISLKRFEQKKSGGFSWGLFLSLLTVAGLIGGFAVVWSKQGRDGNRTFVKLEVINQTVRSGIKRLGRDGRRTVGAGIDADNSVDYNYDELNDQYEYDDDFDTPKVQSTSFQKQPVNRSPIKLLKDTILSSVNSSSGPVESKSCIYTRAPDETSPLEMGMSGCSSKTSTYATYDDTKNRIITVTANECHREETVGGNESETVNNGEVRLVLEDNPLALLDDLE